MSGEPRPLHGGVSDDELSPFVAHNYAAFQAHTSTLGVLCDTLAGMEQLPSDKPRVATATEVASLAGLLDASNWEYRTPLLGGPCSRRGLAGSWPVGM
jgi:hypothetical protein